MCDGGWCFRLHALPAAGHAFLRAVVGAVPAVRESPPLSCLPWCVAVGATVALWFLQDLYAIDYCAVTHRDATFEWPGLGRWCSI